jgi:ATP-dependent Clp protease ATP-binding subunit ClpA
MKREVEQMLFRYFKPEFLNRVDEIITFKRLNREIIRDITLLEINKLGKLLKSAKVSLDITDDAVSQLAEMGFDPVLGARPLKRVIQREIQDKLSTLILEGNLLPESTVHIDYKENQFVFNPQGT